MRFDGTDTSLMVLEKGGEASFEVEFKKQYKAEFGFLLEEKNIIIDDIKVSFRYHSTKLASLLAYQLALSD